VEQGEPHQQEASLRAFPTPSNSPLTHMPQAAYPLYDPSFEHDACGTGFVASRAGIASHAIVRDALTALAHLAHRGALDADTMTSDGAGILTQIPVALLQEWLHEQALPPIAAAQMALGMFFLPTDPDAATRAQAIFDEALAERGATVHAWRLVPIDPSSLGGAAQTTCPAVVQAIIERPADVAVEAFEHVLFAARKATEARWLQADLASCYVASLSTRTVVYKGLLRAEHVADFYGDLRDPRFTSALAVFHQRYSTNTFPSWALAQPFRYLAHNGEINTIQGNRNWMNLRADELLNRHWPAEAATLHPIVSPAGSDSASLDNAVELLTRSGLELAHALTQLVPPAWEHDTVRDATQRAFLQALALKQEPWDGPAALIWSDGRYVGASLDRNGLRPMRYTLTDDLIIVASEAGPLTLDDDQITAKGRLGPGEMIVLDVDSGRLLYDQEIKDELAARHPYSQWVAEAIVPVDGQPVGDDAPLAEQSEVLLPRQALFGFSHEDLELILRPMVTDGTEAIWSMGDDTPLAVLSDQPRPLASFFKQRFAQVTNPPIDALREPGVLSLAAHLGSRDDPLGLGAPAQRILKLASPVLSESGFAAVLAASEANGQIPTTLIATFPVDDSDPQDTYAGAALERTLLALESHAVVAVKAGSQLIILDDRAVPAGHVPLPQPLALAAVHHALARAGLRMRASIIVATGGAWDAHGIALLIGYGADAVLPHLAIATARAWAGTRGLEEITPTVTVDRYCHAVEKGLLKVMTRMGLTVLASYHGAQLYECVGVAPELIERYFPGTPATLSGLSLADLHWQGRTQRITANQLSAARAEDATVRQRLADHGYVRYRRNEEYHSANPAVVKALQAATVSGDHADYVRYTDLIAQRPPTAIRDLLMLRDGEAVPQEEVEDWQHITPRFISTAMSLGALSPEAHLTLTLGAHMVGARSNTGEGGEDPIYYHGERDGVSTNSRIKQVGSGRFGVTTAYLAAAEEIEIKMAQGSKPGEGGQLPSRKVTALIARLRHTSAGVALISPPPHHDIYSIEDLAQLIHDLKQVNPRAAIGVKLVSERGVGTIAAGVAKAHADYILISGYDGGTGASPLSSIKHAGSPWELGLAEAQQVLRLNGLRGRVRLRVDGGLKTGRDVVIAAMLGADEFGFGTAALIAVGCDMARQCHLDTCPAGIATQREDLRLKFTGKPEHVANFLRFIAEEVREILARLGMRSLDEIIGRADLLVAPPVLAALNGLEDTPRTTRIDLSMLVAAPNDGQPFRHMAPTPTAPVTTPEEQLLDQHTTALLNGERLLFREMIHNRDRAVGARLAGAIAARWGDTGLPNGEITYRYEGSAGQSFGAFCVPGLRLRLNGEANDYVAKGMTGGIITIAPPLKAHFDAHAQAIIGNTSLYGATGGLLLAAGRAGERFAVRNSGAVAVVEGTGDHACEYMTNGVVVVLGTTGRNFGAGMSGGVAYVYDEDGHFTSRMNAELVRAERMNEASETDDLTTLLRHHASLTGSHFAASLLARWPRVMMRFWRVLPRASLGADPLRPYLVQVGLPAMAGQRVLE